MSNENSRHLYDLAVKHIPGGVNSPVRAFKGVGGDPLFFKAGQDAYLIDADDNRYVDYVGGFGPLILGHCHIEVVEALRNQLQQGLAFGASTEAEVKIADKICELMPSIEKVRLVTSGTEATMSAIRLARGYTGRDRIVKFEGCYHGHVDGLLVKAGSGALTLGEPDSLGVPKAYTDLTHVLAGNMNCVPPVPGFLEALREHCTKYGAVLIFDEVMTGFRVALGGAQSVYQVTPDLTTIGKVIGGGLPVGAFGGKTEIMELIAPLGGVYQAGTLAGSPLAVAAGLAMLNVISKPGFHDELAARTTTLLNGLQERADQAGIAFTTNQVGAMFGCFFTEEKQVSHFSQVMSCDTERFKHYFHSMLDNGVYLAPSAFEAGFVSSAHCDTEIQLTLDAAEKAFAALPK